jgi:hypothetical protein
MGEIIVLFLEKPDAAALIVQRIEYINARLPCGKPSAKKKVEKR